MPQSFPTIHVEPKVKINIHLKIKMKKFQKVIGKLTKDGWLIIDGWRTITFYHPMCLTTQQIRERLNKIKLLTTHKCRIEISGTEIYRKAI